METPTPVSALLHAGVINAGGFLLLRFAGFVSCSTSALDALALIGGFTALFGSVVMLTQTSIKVSLAYSTIGQMGFMMLECGLGAFPAAYLHLFGHSLYKAHSFLSAGSVLEGVRPHRSAAPRGAPPVRLSLLALALVVTVGFAVLYLVGPHLSENPGGFVLGSIVLLAAGRLGAAAVDARPEVAVITRVCLQGGCVVAAYAVLQRISAQLLSGAVPADPIPRGTFDVAIVAIVLLSFGLVIVWQSVLPGNRGTPRWQALQVHVSNGLYVNTLTNRLIVRWWPAGSEAGAGR
jgi:NAD(P)H-quinone oxidoreductase subunit 5